MRIQQIQWQQLIMMPYLVKLISIFDHRGKHRILTTCNYADFHKFSLFSILVFDQLTYRMRRPFRKHRPCKRKRLLGILYTRQCIEWHSRTDIEHQNIHEQLQTVGGIYEKLVTLVNNKMHNETSTIGDYTQQLELFMTYKDDGQSLSHV